MKTIDIFPTTIFTFQNSNIDNEFLINHIRNNQYPVKNSGVLSVLHDFQKDNIFFQLFKWFETCLEEIRTSLNYDCEKFTVTSSWCNISLANKGMGLNFHKHSLSFLSGVYYLTDGTPTVFEDPVIQRTQAQIEVLRKNYQPIHIMPAAKGQLCIFPSWIYHGTLAHIDNFDRYIISFNSMPNGKINYETAFDSKANIKIL